MAKKSSVSSRSARLKRMISADIEGRRWTERERRSLRRIASRQVVGDDSRISFADIPRLTAEQLATMVRLRDVRRRKVAVSVRLDPQVLDWLKSKGKGHLTRINDILLNLMEAEPKDGVPSGIRTRVITVKGQISLYRLRRLESARISNSMG